MGIGIVSIFVLLGCAIGSHTNEDGGDLEAKSALPQPSWKDLGPLPFGGVPRQEDIVLETFPRETLITRASIPAEVAEHGKSAA